MDNRARSLGESLENLLNSKSDEFRQAEETTRVSRQDLRQALLDALSDDGHETNNHAHSRDRAGIDPDIERLQKLADKLAHEREDQVHKINPAAGNALSFRPAGANDLNSDFKNLEGNY